MSEYQQTSFEAQPLDPEVVASLRALRMDGAPDLLGELIDLFENDMPRLFDRLRQAVNQRDPVEMAQVAHSCKGSSANFGADGLSGLFRRLEELGRSGSTEGAAGLLQSIDVEYERVVAALERERESTE